MRERERERECECEREREREREYAQISEREKLQSKFLLKFSYKKYYQSSSVLEAIILKIQLYHGVLLYENDPK